MRASVLALTLLFVATSSALRAQEPSPLVDADIVTAPVEVDGEVLFHVRGVTSLPAASRAANVRERVVEVASDRTVAPESLRVVETTGASRITAGSRLIALVIDADAGLEQVPRADLADAHMTRIREAIVSYRQARTASALRSSALKVLLATTAFVLMLVVMHWFRRLADRRVVTRLATRIAEAGGKPVEVIGAERLGSGFHHLLLAIHAVAVLLLTLAYLGYALDQFPWTRARAGNVLGLVALPFQVIGTGIIENIPEMTFLVVLFLIVRLGLRLIRRIFEGIEHGAMSIRGFEPDWAEPTYKFVRVAVIAFSLIVAYPYIPGSQSAAFQGISIFVGVLFSLGASSAVANIVAGYALIYRRAFRIGDRVKIGDGLGDVIETRLQVTHLRSIKNEEIIVPNSQILGAEVLNYSSFAKAQGLILHTEVSIGYGVPWRDVESMLFEAAARTEGLLSDPKPFVLVKKLDTFSVIYELNVYCDNAPMMARLYSALHRHVLDVFSERGVQIMVPAYESDPPEPKIAPVAARAVGGITSRG